MTRLSDRVLRRIEREGWPRFWAGDHWGWVVLALIAYLVRRDRQRRTRVVSMVGLHPGERYLVTLTEPK